MDINPTINKAMITITFRNYINGFSGEDFETKRIQMHDYDHMKKPEFELEKKDKIVMIPELKKKDKIVMEPEFKKKDKIVVEKRELE